MAESTMGESQTGRLYNNFMFTMNNPEGLVVFDPVKMKYLVYQEEQGHEDHTDHLQGYCELKKQLTLKQVKELLGQEAHIQHRRGTQEEAVVYCKKEDTRIDGPYEYGTPKVPPGTRSDLISFAKDVREGKRKRELFDDHLSVMARYRHLYDDLNWRQPERTKDIEVVLLIGDTGLGKSRYVMDKHKGDDSFWIAPLSNGTSWYDRYDGHKAVLLDDFCGKASHQTLNGLLRLLDRYPVSVPTKGSHTWWLPDIIYVTTNIKPKDWYTWEKRTEQYKALARRFTSIKVFTAPGTWVETPGFFRENAPSEVTYFF